MRRMVVVLAPFVLFLVPLPAGALPNDFTPHGPPTNPRTSYTCEPSTIRLEWEPPTGTFTHYEITANYPDTDTWLIGVTPPTQTFYDVAGYVPGLTYHVKAVGARTPTFPQDPTNVGALIIWGGKMATMGIPRFQLDSARFPMLNPARLTDPDPGHCQQGTEPWAWRGTIWNRERQYFGIPEHEPFVVPIPPDAACWILHATTNAAPGHRIDVRVNKVPVNDGAPVVDAGDRPGADLGTTVTRIMPGGGNQTVEVTGGLVYPLPRYYDTLLWNYFEGFYSFSATPASGAACLAA